jgi:hypothetical protein
MAEVPFTGLSKTPHGRYRLLWATDLLGETDRRGWITMPIMVHTEQVRAHRERLETEHGFERPDREDTVDLALAVALAAGMPTDDEITVRKLLCKAYDESDRFGP